MSDNTEEVVRAPKMEFTLKDFIGIYKEKKKRIFANCLILGILTAVLVYFVIDPIFLSYGTVKTTGKVLGLGMGISVPEISEFGEVLSGSSSSKELALYENILLSRRCLEEYIVRFGLMEENDYKNMQKAIKDVRENILYILKDKVSGTMDIGVYDKDPVKSKEMSEFLIGQLDKINIEMNRQNAKNQRDFIQERYEASSAELIVVEDSLKQFQDIYGLSPEIQVKEVSELEIKLEAEIESEKIKLELLQKIISPGEDEVQYQRDKINVLERRLYDLQNSTDGNSKLQLKGTPDIVLNFIRLKRNVEIQNKILSVLLPLYEQAKIEEKKEIPTIIVLDQPFVPDEKSKPKRLTSIFVVMVLGFIFSYGFFFIKKQLKRIEGTLT
ncbi:MAG: GNVR domain-containing protein [Ignavibacteria bacterium]